MKSWNGPGEGAPLIAPPRSPPAPAGDSIRIRALVLTLATCMVGFGFDTLFPDVKNVGPPRWTRPSGLGHHKKPFEWSQIEPSADLEFHDCFVEFECAKLKVPLDYFNGSHPQETVSIAITKLPAVVSVDDPRYGGPILINPGGPGGPGALFAVAVGKMLQAIVDSGADPTIETPSAKYYDIIGFDPRGIGETEPSAYCMADTAAAWSWSLRETTEGILGSSDAALGRLWSMSHAWGTSCKQAMDAEGGPDIKQFMSTAFVARDMLEIVEKHAVHVAEAFTQLDLKKNIARMPEAVPSKPSEAKLQYWGFSYGTFLGSTFASMYPDRVGRVILDGVVSSYDYEHSLGNGSLTDNQKAMDSFYTYCVYAGSDVCPLTTSNSTFKDVQDRVQSIVQSLYHNPLAIMTPTGPEILTYSDVKALLFSACYQPQAVFALIANLLAEIEVGHGELLDQISFQYRYSHIYSCPIDGSKPGTDVTSSVPTFAILCSDGIDQSHVNIDEFVEYWELLESISPTAGAIWAILKLRCTSWKIKASYKYEGAFGGNTSHPILFISNTADPVTPLRSGRVMQSLFPDSGLLISDHAGHCSVAQMDLCTLTHIREYFQTGKVPTPNTLCVPPPSAFSLNSTDPKSPFYDPTLGEMVIERTNPKTVCTASEEAVLSRAGYGLARDISEHDFFGVGKLIGARGLTRNILAMAAEESTML